MSCTRLPRRKRNDPEDERAHIGLTGFIAPRFAPAQHVSIIGIKGNIAAVEASGRLIVVTHHVPHPGCLTQADPDTASASPTIARHADRIDLVVHGRRRGREGALAQLVSRLLTNCSVPPGDEGASRKRVKERDRAA